MTRKNNLKKIRQFNLLKLKESIDNDSIDGLIDFNREWGGAYVVVTSNPERVFDPEIDENDWMGRRAACTYVLTKHALKVSKFLSFVDHNVMARQDNYLFGFIALLANDFIKQFGDVDNYTLLLDYLFSGVSFYFSYYDGESGMGNSRKAFELMRFFLSEKTSDEEIRHIF